MNNFKEILDNVIMYAYDVQHYFDNYDEDQYSSALIKLTENSRKIVSEMEQAREALRAVEWVELYQPSEAYSDALDVCPWCHNIAIRTGYKHAPDCLRQKALGEL